MNPKYNYVLVVEVLPSLAFAFFHSSFLSFCIIYSLASLYVCVWLHFIPNVCMFTPRFVVNLVLMNRLVCSTNMLQDDCRNNHSILVSGKVLMHVCGTTTYCILYVLPVWVLCTKKGVQFLYFILFRIWHWWCFICFMLH